MPFFLSRQTASALNRFDANIKKKSKSESEKILTRELTVVEEIAEWRAAIIPRFGHLDHFVPLGFMPREFHLPKT